MMAPTMRLLFEFPHETGLIRRFTGNVGNPLQTIGKDPLGHGVEVRGGQEWRQGEPLEVRISSVLHSEGFLAREGSGL